MRVPETTRVAQQAAREDAEEALDIRVGSGVAVAVEVGRAAGGAAVLGEAGEEGLVAGDAVVVEAEGAAGAVNESLPPDHQPRLMRTGHNLFHGIP